MREVRTECTLTEAFCAPGIDSNVTRIAQSSKAINTSALGDSELFAATGWGTRRLLVNVLQLELPGLTWVVVVVLRQTILASVNYTNDTVAFTIGVGAIVVVGLIVVTATSGGKKLIGQDKGRKAIGVTKLRSLVAIAKQELSEKPVRKLHGKAVNVFSLMAQQSDE